MFPFAITYAVWLPAEIFFYAAVAYFSKRNNDSRSRKFLAVMILLNFIPLWPFIAPDSTHLAFDGMLFDSVMILVQTSVLIFLGASNKFRPHNYLGIALIIVGLALMRL